MTETVPVAENASRAVVAGEVLARLKHVLDTSVNSTIRADFDQVALEFGVIV